MTAASAASADADQTGSGDVGGGKTAQNADPTPAGDATGGVTTDPTAASTADAASESTAGQSTAGKSTTTEPTASPDGTADPAPAGAAPPDAPEVTVDLDVPATGADAEPTAVGTAEVPAQPEGVEGAPVVAEIETLRGDLGELTRDLQRISAEYANYRKRVDRDRLLVGEQATGAVLTALLPVLDDLDRARAHGDLVGPFATMAEQLSTALAKFGLTAFGEAGDPFDPAIHEAVAHSSSADVTETTCVEIMRRGYQLGERLLRPALVAVADPE